MAYLAGAKVSHNQVKHLDVGRVLHGLLHRAAIRKLHLARNHIVAAIRKGDAIVARTHRSRRAVQGYNLPRQLQQLAEGFDAIVHAGAVQLPCYESGLLRVQYPRGWRLDSLLICGD